MEPIVVNENVYLPNSYNDVLIDPSWTDPKSFISPGLTLKEAIIHDVKMHVISIVNSNTSNGFIISKQIVDANWDNWKTIFA